MNILVNTVRISYVWVFAIRSVVETDKRFLVSSQRKQQIYFLLRLSMSVHVEQLDRFLKHLTMSGFFFFLLKSAATLRFLLKLNKNETPDMTVYVHSKLMRLLTPSWFSRLLATSLPMVTLKCQTFPRSAEIL